MVRYCVMLDFTDEGIREINGSIARADAFAQAVEQVGGRLIAQYWLVGMADGCFVFEAPDEATAAALLLQLGREGKVRTRTSRAYDKQEFAQALK